MYVISVIKKICGVCYFCCYKKDMSFYKKYLHLQVELPVARTEDTVEARVTGPDGHQRKAEMFPVSPGCYRVGFVPDDCGKVRCMWREGFGCC